MADLCIGTIPLSPDLQLRVTLTTERGRQVVDLRAFDRFAGVWMPSKKGLSVPAEHAELYLQNTGQRLDPKRAESPYALARLTREAYGRGVNRAFRQFQFFHGRQAARAQARYHTATNRKRTEGVVSERTNTQNARLGLKRQA